MVGIGFSLDYPIVAANDYQQNEAKEATQAAQASAQILQTTVATAAPAPQPNSSQTVIRASGVLAKQSRFVDAISLLDVIDSTDPSYPVAQRLTGQWVNAIVERGQQKIGQGKVQQGLAILQAIPSEDRTPEASQINRTA